MTYKEYEELINKAAEVSGGDNRFVVGCRRFLKDVGFLTVKQVKCLENPLPPYGRGLVSGYDSYEDGSHGCFPGDPSDYGHYDGES